MTESATDDATLLDWRHRQIQRTQRQRLGLWRSLGRSNRLFPRKLVVTREGKWIIGIALLLGAGAVNTGNNLLYLVLALTISVIAVSGILSEWNLQHLRARRRYPSEIDVGEAVPLRVEVENSKRRPVLHIEVGEISDAPDVLVRPGYVLHLQPGEVGHAFAAVRALRRGPVQTVGLQVATAYPYGFARKARLYPQPAWFLALPNVARVEVPWLGAVRRDGDTASPRTGQGDEYRGLRDAKPGDLPRDVHWKVSARRERLIVREWEAQASKVALVRFVHVGPSPDGDEGPPALDAACATVAGLCATLLEAGLAVGLQTFEGTVPPAADLRAVGPGSALGSDQLQRIRRHLAHLTVADRRPPPEWPVEDREWLERCAAADERRQQIARREPLQWAPLGVYAAAEVFQVEFASRPDVAGAGSVDVRVPIQASGEVVGLERVTQPLHRGAA
jgi:uncharacterized protein (DUF58 family)